jgi:hypothetical protein
MHYWIIDLMHLCTARLQLPACFASICNRLLLRLSWSMLVVVVTQRNKTWLCTRLIHDLARKQQIDRAVDWDLSRIAPSTSATFGFTLSTQFSLHTYDRAHCLTRDTFWYNSVTVRCMHAAECRRQKWKSFIKNNHLC